MLLNVSQSAIVSLQGAWAKSQPISNSLTVAPTLLNVREQNGQQPHVCNQVSTLQLNQSVNTPSSESPCAPEPAHPSPLRPALVCFTRTALPCSAHNLLLVPDAKWWPFARTRAERQFPEEPLAGQKDGTMRAGTRLASLAVLSPLLAESQAESRCSVNSA